MTPSDKHNHNSTNRDIPMESSAAMATRSSDAAALVATDAVDLIRQLDAAFGDMNASILAGTMEADEARKNARVAAELARRFSRRNGSSEPHSNNNTNGGRKDGEKSSTTFSPSVTPKSSRVQPMRPSNSTSYTSISPHVSNGSFRPSPNVRAPVTTSTIGNTTQTTDRESSLNFSSSQRAAKVAERLAATHAEELLHVSLELERTKEQLESEQLRHDETKSALHQAKQTTASTEQHLERLLQNMETAREENGRRIDELENDLYRAAERIKTAEVEAETAMDICVQADRAKEESDRSLQRALAQINSLKEYIAHQHSAEDYLRHTVTEECGDDDSSERRRRVRFQDDVTASPAATAAQELFDLNISQASDAFLTNRPSRALVAMGRQILQRSFSSDPNTPLVSQNVIEASRERHLRLRHHLESLDTTGMEHVDAVSDPTMQHRTQKSRDMVRHHLSSAVDAMNVCRSVAQIIKESGRRLNLSGRGFVGSQLDSKNDSIADEIHLETLTKHYTTMVEVQMEKKHKEVLALESLVSLLEQGIP